MTAQPPIWPDDELLGGRYRIGGLIGQGGMGRVWHGTDELLGRDVAVKELALPPGMDDAEREELRKRMLREARTAAQLSHPSIVTVYDVVEVDERPWIIMELVRAVPLSDLIHEHGHLAPDRVAGFAVQLIEALATAHAHGVVHRDVTPGNVLVTASERVVLTDFGIAVHDGDSVLNRTGVLVGSPSYLAPEVALGEPARPPADLWSLGATLYAALAGRSPFHRADPMATLNAIIHEEPPPLASTGPLQPVLTGLLRKDPTERMTGAEAGRVLLPATDLWLGIPPDETQPIARLPGSRAGSALRHRDRLWALQLLVLIASGLLALLVAAEAGLFNERSSAAPAASDGEEAAVAPAEEDSSGARHLPEGMRSYEDGSGFSLYVPETWRIHHEASSVFFTSPEGGYLRVDSTGAPDRSAREIWKLREREATANFPAYERVAITEIEPPSSRAYVSAADWEFTYTSHSAGDMRAINRALHTEEVGYTLLLTGPEKMWDGGYRELLRVFTASFVPKN